MSDYYLTEKQLAAYIEAEWIDRMPSAEPLQSRNRAVPATFIQSDFCTQAPALIAEKLTANGLSPATLLEVGPGCGRVNYELVSALTDLEWVYVIEPSRLLLDSFTDILLAGGVNQYDCVSSTENARLEFDTTALAEKYRALHVETWNEPAVEGIEVPPCDLVVCLNVLDQCESPRQLISFLMSKVAAGGVLALSCSYQWSSKHLKDPDEQTGDINQYFDEDWKRLGEQDMEYRFRVNERYSMLFLSHTVIYRRIQP